MKLDTICQQCKNSTDEIKSLIQGFSRAYIMYRYLKYDDSFHFLWHFKDLNSNEKTGDREIEYLWLPVKVSGSVSGLRYF